MSASRSSASFATASVSSAAIPRMTAACLPPLTASFLTLRDRVTGSDDASVIAEVDHGESYLNGKWETALQDGKLSAETRSIIQRAYDSVREGRDRFRRLHEDMSGTTTGGTTTGGTTGGLGGGTSY